jgi:hypothetical protein
MKAVAALGVFFAGALLGGCASITGTSNQPVSVRSSCGMNQVSGAACKLSNDKGEWYVTRTPGSVTIRKAYADLAIECEKPGLGKGARVYTSTANASMYGNILVGGLIGFAMDSGSGSGFDYPQAMSVDICNGETPADINVVEPAAQKTQVQVSAPAAPSTPAPRSFRPAACDWGNVKQGTGAC